MKEQHNLDHQLNLPSAPMQGWKNNNDPWVPLPESNGDVSSEDAPESSAERPLRSNGILQAALPPNPLHQLMDSQTYIETLEKKLEKLTARKKEPTSRDIINSLALFHEDQMKRYVNSDTAVWAGEACTGSDESLASSSFLKRKIYPEQQALSAEELLELLKSDAVAISHEERNLQGDQSSCPIEQENIPIEIQNEEDKITDNAENWANFDDMERELSSEEFSHPKE